VLVVAIVVPMVAGCALVATAALAAPTALRPRVLAVTPAAAAAKSVRVMRLRIDYFLPLDDYRAG
jgi:hypothetical protein